VKPLSTSIKETHWPEEPRGSSIREKEELASLSPHYSEDLEGTRTPVSGFVLSQRLQICYPLPAMKVLLLVIWKGLGGAECSWLSNATGSEGTCIPPT